MWSSTPMARSGSVSSEPPSSKRSRFARFTSSAGSIGSRRSSLTSYDSASSNGTTSSSISSASSGSFTSKRSPLSYAGTASPIILENYPVPTLMQTPWELERSPRKPYRRKSSAPTVPSRFFTGQFLPEEIYECILIQLQALHKRSSTSGPTCTPNSGSTGCEVCFQRDLCSLAQTNRVWRRVAEEYLYVSYLFYSLLLPISGSHIHLYNVVLCLARFWLAQVVVRVVGEDYLIKVSVDWSNASGHARMQDGVSVLTTSLEQIPQFIPPCRRDVRLHDPPVISPVYTLSAVRSPQGEKQAEASCAHPTRAAGLGSPGPQDRC